MNLESATVDNDILTENVVWRIQPSHDSFFGQLAAFWRYRSVSVAVAQQVIANRAQRKLLGLPWMFVQPIRIHASSNVHPWQGFQYIGCTTAPAFVHRLRFGHLDADRRGLQQATRSLKMCRSMTSRIYIPPFIFVCASVSPALVQFSLFYRYRPWRPILCLSSGSTTHSAGIFWRLCQRLSWS